MIFIIPQASPGARAVHSIRNDSRRRAHADLALQKKAGNVYAVWRNTQAAGHVQLLYGYAIVVQTTCLTSLTHIIQVH